MGHSDKKWADSSMIETLTMRIMKTTTACKLTLPSLVCCTGINENAFQPASMIAKKRIQKFL